MLNRRVNFWEKICLMCFFGVLQIKILRIIYAAAVPNVFVQQLFETEILACSIASSLDALI